MSAAIVAVSPALTTGRALSLTECYLLDLHINLIIPFFGRQDRGREALARGRLAASDQRPKTCALIHSVILPHEAADPSSGPRPGIPFRHSTLWVTVPPSLPQSRGLSS